MGVLRALRALCAFGITYARAQSLWASAPANYSDFIRTAYPVGNGRLGAMLLGDPNQDIVNLNVDSLWSGGPFEDPSYTGRNPNASVAGYLPGIREWIFANGTGNITGLLGGESGYGSYSVLANLTVSMDIEAYSSYNRSLDLKTGVHSNLFKTNNSSYSTSVPHAVASQSLDHETTNKQSADIVTYSRVYCSYPDQVCVYSISASQTLPKITVGIGNELLDQSLVSVTCKTNQLRMRARTQALIEMQAEAIIRLNTKSKAQCSNSTSTLTVFPLPNVKSLTLIVGAGTDYDQTKGNTANGFSFKGEDPAAMVESTTSAAAAKGDEDLKANHVSDYTSLTSLFSLTLPDSAGSAGIETSALIDRYTATSLGDPYLESLMFMYGRHLFIGSSRKGSLPPNLQGRWATGLWNAWSGDYHANINLQMNHWGVDQTGLGALQAPLWDYMQNTWVPRGSQTARLLYGAPGWVLHDEINIFGHTAMKEDAQWANYPAGGAWMMAHVWDHYEYSADDAWWTSQGYPLVMGHAEFWLSQLQKDDYFNDGTLVVNPCNSPEHGATTFGCTHYQQLITEMFSNILAATPPSTDPSFISNLTDALEKLDTGLHIGSWGQIQEWKLDLDIQGDTHRHLSNLYGWYPGYSISGLAGGLSNSTITDAVKTTLVSRGPGQGPDADAGWEKVWRSACWARLNNTDEAYYELRFATAENIAANGLSMYSASDPPFQIDANYGIVGAMLAMLVTDLPRTNALILGPAIPAAWGGGSVEGLVVRGGGVLEFSWDAQGMVTEAVWKVVGKPRTVVNRDGAVLLGS